MPSKKLPADFAYLPDMYEDDYFPKSLVDKIKTALQQTVGFIESGEHSSDEIQASFDKTIVRINELQEEFEENESEIETGARESIGETIDRILKHFELDIDVEDAMRERDW